MIQRVQTLFLVLAGLLFSMMIFFPLASFLTHEQQVYTLYAFSITDSLNPAWTSPLSSVPIGILLVMIAGISLVSIFLYKRRILQARLATINMILAILWPALVWFICWLGEESLHATYSLEAIIVVSWIGAVLQYMARRRILIDEALVKSFDRIR